MHFCVDILIVLYIFGFGTARLGEWRLNHIHSINGAEVINASCSDSSAEIDYSLTFFFPFRRLTFLGPYCWNSSSPGMG